MTRPKINVEVCQTPNGMWMVRVQEWVHGQHHDSNVCELRAEEAIEIGRIALRIFNTRWADEIDLTEPQMASQSLPDTPSHLGAPFTCPHCGSDVLGDGVTVALHCEFADEAQLFACPPDEGPIYCTPESIGCE